MSFLSDRVQAVKPSPTLAIDQKAKELIAAGVDVVNLATGEPDFPTPQHVCEGAIKAIHEGKHKYTAVDGIPELKKAIIAKFKADNGLDYQADQRKAAFPLDRAAVGGHARLSISRGWLKARMPAFPAHAALITRGLAAEHGISSDDPGPADDPAMIEAGRLLTLKARLDCRQCHSLDSVTATQEIAPKGSALVYRREIAVRLL